jgi:biotin carboxylase
MKKNIAIIGASAFQDPLIKKAQEKGYKTHVFAWKAGDVGEKTADVFHPISIVEKEAILAECRRLDIAGICSIGSDLAMLTVSYVAEALGLTANTMACVEKSTNKGAMRRAFAAGGDPIPGFMEGDAATTADQVDLCYPLIVKPTDRSGSRGVTRVESPEALVPAIAGALKDSFEKKVMIEEYAGGQEYSVECVSWQGQHHFLALTKKYTTGAPHFIETGHDEPAPVDEETLGRIEQVVFHALDSLGITMGASHTELKIEGDAIRLIEIGGRMGGDCIGSHLVPVSTGKDFVGMVVDIACGAAPDLTVKTPPVPVSVRFIFDEKDLSGYRELAKAHPERIVDAVIPRPQAMDHAITDSSTRYGFYIYRRPEEV